MINAIEAHHARCKALVAKKAVLDKWLERSLKTIDSFIQGALNSQDGRAQMSVLIPVAKELDGVYQMQQLVAVLTKGHGYQIEKCAKANQHGTSYDIVISWAHLDCDDCHEQNDEPKKDGTEALADAIVAMHDALKPHSHKETCNA